MGKFTSSKAPCATVVGKENNVELLCGHFPADHTWDDPQQKRADESAELWADRVAAEEADKEASAKREEAAQDRRTCHAYVGHGNPACTCKSYTDSTASIADRKAAAAAESVAADKAMNDRINKAVAAALKAQAEENAKVAAGSGQ